MCGVGNLTRAAYANQRMTLAGEFLCYVVVGGLAFVVDLGALVLAQELLFGHEPLCVQLGASGRTAAVRRESEGTGVHEEI